MIKTNSFLYLPFAVLPFLITEAYAEDYVQGNNQQFDKPLTRIDFQSSKLPLAEKNALQPIPQYFHDTPISEDILETKLTDQTLLNKELGAELENNLNQDGQGNQTISSAALSKYEETHYQPAFTNSAWEQFEVEQDFYDTPYQVSLFSPQHGEDGERLWSQTTSIFYYGLGVVGVLAALPESVTNWDSDNDQSIAEKWLENVKEGPVWDRDDAILNYVMHPYFGGVYYQSARKSGYRQWDSFLYSALMSTVFWEYGVEAFAETPSMQDLVVTPVLGWVYGEWAFNTEREIWAGGGTVWGSEYLGNTALFLLDPVDSLGRNVNRLFGRDLIKAGTGYVKISEQSTPGGLQTDKQVMFEINYLFGDDSSLAQPGISGKRKLGERYSFANAKDPVDVGIIGLSVGTGYLNFDRKRGQLNNKYAQISLGLYFSKRFSTRLNYSSSKLLKEVIEQYSAYETFSVDGQYYFNTDSNLRPYITAGIGEEIWDEDNDSYNLQLNAGVGLHYRLNAKWALQADLVNYYTTDEESHHQQLIGKVVYRFGAGEIM
ncbi:DUF3943 domain-containing protein [Psychromonas arctica]|uniref:DUF3943 domain-containing protein n=1 Tax=Psychromonas arctica TaxID=168275 RepID=UPI00040C25EF|nr:DUF3943 domain-containing protein [Psychromonas arctica]